MNLPTAAALLLVAVAAGVALGGCELSSSEPLTEEEYVAEAEGVADEFIESATRVAKEVQNVQADLGSVGNLIGTFAEEAEALAARIEDINPPAAVEQLHQQLIEILDDFAGKAETAAAALKAGDLLGGIPALTKLAADALNVGDRLESTVDSIRERLGIAAADVPELSEPATERRHASGPVSLGDEPADRSPRRVGTASAAVAVDAGIPVERRSR